MCIRFIPKEKGVNDDGVANYAHKWLCSGRGATDCDVVLVDTLTGITYCLYKAYSRNQDEGPCPDQTLKIFLIFPKKWDNM